MIKKVVSMIMLMSLLIILTGCAGDDFDATDATDAEYFTFDSSSGAIMDYDEEGGVNVVIPPKINGVEVEVIEADAFAHGNLRTLIIPPQVRVIEDGAFNRNELTSVEYNEGLEK